MADFRTVHTEMWRADEWFQGLDTDARLFWIYLFTNPSASVSGIYRLPLRTMAFESGLSIERITELLAMFAKDGKAFYESGVIWVRKMRDYQLPGKISPQLAAHLKHEIDKIPASILKNRYMEAYGYSIDKVSILRPTDTDTDTDTDTPKPSIPSVLVIPSASSGRRASAHLKDLNREVSAELRTPIANELLEFTGKLALAEVPDDAGQTMLNVAHEYAKTLYLMGYKTAEALLPVEEAWGKSWKSKDNTKPTFKQFVEFASEQLSARNGNGAQPSATAVY